MHHQWYTYHERKAKQRVNRVLTNVLTMNACQFDRLIRIRVEKLKKKSIVYFTFILIIKRELCLSYRILCENIIIGLIISM